MDPGHRQRKTSLQDSRDHSSKKTRATFLFSLSIVNIPDGKTFNVERRRQAKFSFWVVWETAMGCLFLSAQVKEKLVLLQTCFFFVKKERKEIKDRWHSQFLVFPFCFVSQFVSRSLRFVISLVTHAHRDEWKRLKGWRRSKFDERAQEWGINGAQLCTLRSKMHTTAYREPNSMKLPSLLQNWLQRESNPEAGELLILYLCFVQFQWVSREKKGEKERVSINQLGIYTRSSFFIPSFSAEVKATKANRINTSSLQNPFLGDAHYVSRYTVKG